MVPEKVDSKSLVHNPLIEVEVEISKNLSAADSGSTINSSALHGNSELVVELDKFVEDSKVDTEETCLVEEVLEIEPVESIVSTEQTKDDFKTEENLNLELVDSKLVQDQEQSNEKFPVLFPSIIDFVLGDLNLIKSKIYLLPHQVNYKSSFWNCYNLVGHQTFRFIILQFSKT
ncbi:hypothetical protein ACH5RR_023317 [Cinchona calisaya]|uniref:Uncharacterized protein n=1 Tax=Cinchona calisaya TaxID=153742 RepID=A0ABD2ZDL5_9GENT